MTEPAEQNPTPSSQESAFHGQGIPLVKGKPAHQALFPYFLTALGTLLVVGVGGYFWQRSPARAQDDVLKAEARVAQILKEYEAKQVARDKQLELERQEQLLAEYRGAHSRLADRAGGVLAKIDEFEAARGEWNELRASLNHTGFGREIAGSASLLTKFTRIENEQARIDYAPESSRERVGPIADRSRKIAAGSAVAAPPSVELGEELALDLKEVNDALAAQKQTIGALRALLSEAAKDDLPPAAVELEEAIALRDEQFQKQQSDIYAEAEARRQAEQLELDEKKAEAETAAMLEAEKQRHQADLESLRQKNEEALRGLKEQYDKELALLKEQLAGKVAAIEGEIRVAEASTAAKKSEKELEAERIALEAEKQRLREKCRSPEVANALAPFIGKGYWQPGKAEPGLDPGPVSFTAIQAAGALDQTVRGARELYFLGANPKNDRPGVWPDNERLAGFPDEKWLKNKPAARERAVKAQAFLIELGPTLVELGLLAP